MKEQAVIGVLHTIRVLITLRKILKFVGNIYDPMRLF